MITIIFLIVLAGAAIGGVYMAFSGGMKGGRHGQAGMAKVRGQESEGRRGDVRSGDGLD